MKKNTTISVLCLLLLFSLFANYKLFLIKQEYKNLIPYLLVGEEIKNVDLIDSDAQLIDPSQITKGVSVIFVFLKRCSPCDKNIIYWKKIAQMFENKISVTGVVLNTPTEGFNFEKEAKLNFRVYVPDNLTKYTKDMRIRLNQSQTIVLRDGKVKLVTMGDLSGKNAIEIINKIKGLLK